MSKEIREDAKLLNLSKDQKDELWLMRYPVDGEKKLKYSEIVELLEPRFGLTASPSTLSDFFKRERQRREFEEAVARAEEGKLQYAAMNPEASPEKLQSVGQMIFTNKSIVSGDLNGFVKLVSLAERRAAREFDEEKFKESLKSKLQVGLDAMFAEIQDNPKALEAFELMKKAMAES